MTVADFDDDLIDRDDPGVLIDGETGRLSYRGVPFTGYVEVGSAGGPCEFWSYVDGDRDGTWTGWYANGVERYDGMFTANRPHGVWEERYPSGRLRRVDRYDFDDGLESSVVYDEDGQIIEIWDELTRKGVPRDAVDVSDPLLSIDSGCGRADYDGVPFSGSVIERIGASGPIVGLETYVDGRRDGPIRSWYFTGGIRSSGAYSAGRAVGLWVEYAQDGKLVSESVLSPGGGIVSRRMGDGREPR